MEALKLLMLARAVEFYTAMQRGDDVPILFWLLFTRETSSCPRTFLANHLSQVGSSGGVEQVRGAKGTIVVVLLLLSCFCSFCGC